jgi:putative nucleotidyltransferase with HDIG domain
MMSKAIFHPAKLEKNFHMRDIRIEINRINEVVSFTPVVAEILQTMTNQNVATKKITQLIESDQALTAKILHIANSPFYGLSTNINSIGCALTMLGLDEIGHLLLTCQMKARLASLNSDQNETLWKLWKHSVVTASIARLIANRFRFPTEGKEYTAGLLHDMGKLVVIQYFPKEYAMVESLIQDLSITDIDAEMQTLAISHTEIGYQLGQKWRLPKEYLDVMQYHHSVRMSQNNMVMISLVRFADLLSEQWGDGVGEQSEALVFADQECVQVLGESDPEFAKEPIERIIEELFAEFEKTSDVVGILS